MKRADPAGSARYRLSKNLSCEPVRTLRLAKSRPSGGCSLAWRLRALMAWESVLQNVSFLLKVRLKPQVLGDADCHVAAFWAAPRNDILVSILF